MSNKCPYCYRILGTWTKDPILLPNGSKYKFISDTELESVEDVSQRQYKGIYQVSIAEVSEIRDMLTQLEIENLDEEDRTDWSAFNTAGVFQMTGQHIKEMRESIEKLLDAVGSNKTEFFNYDADENHIIHPLGDKIDWTDPITQATDLQKFQVKYIHLEDLRHAIAALWKETWDTSFTFSESFLLDATTYPTNNYINVETITEDHTWDYLASGHADNSPSFGQECISDYDFSLTDLITISIISQAKKATTTTYSASGVYGRGYVLLESDNISLPIIVSNKGLVLDIQESFTFQTSMTGAYHPYAYLGTTPLTAPDYNRASVYGQAFIVVLFVLSGSVGNITRAFLLGENTHGDAIPYNFGYVISGQIIDGRCNLTQALLDESFTITQLENSEIEEIHLWINAHSYMNNQPIQVSPGIIQDFYYQANASLSGTVDKLALKRINIV